MTTPDEERILHVAVVGSRTFRDYRLLCDTLDALRDEYGRAPGNPVTIRLVSGGAQGADKLGERYAAENDLQIEVFKPEWRDARGKYKPNAGFERNTDIVNKADIVVAFWDFKSHGTRDSIAKAEALGKEVRKIRF